MTVLSLLATVLLALPNAGLAAQSQTNLHLQAPNPVRKVVNLLQAMQKKVEEEGEKEQKLHDEYVCYCKTNIQQLDASLQAAGTKGPELEAEIKGSQEQKAQLEADLKQAKADREAAKKVVEQANAIREKDAETFAAMKKETEGNIGAMGKALEALRRGTGAAFLQSNAAQVLRGMVQSRDKMIEDDRQALASFLDTQGSESAPSDMIIGILSQLLEEMQADLKQAEAAEAEAVKGHAELVAAKEKEVEALTQGIESKTERLGELGVTIVNLQNDLNLSQGAAQKNAEFKAQLEKACADRKAEFEERVKTRSEELVALADTIKMLNDDDALDLFKKTLPGASSFMQVQVSAASVRARALDVMRRARGHGQGGTVLLDLVSLALRSKKVSFDKVIQMVDSMVEQLKKEQGDDERKKAYCAKEFDLAEDKKKNLDRAVADIDTSIASTAERIATLKDEISKLEVDIQELDKAVAEAAEQRKEEHADFNELIASNNAAKQLLLMAKNRLNKFYNPSLASFLQVASRAHHHKEPYQKSEESAGVLAMLDTLIKDLDKEITEAEAEEKNAQKDYEILTKDSAAKRMADQQSLADKGNTVADLEASLEALKSQKGSTTKELMATLEYIQNLHSDCDWLVQNFDMRKEARTGEIDSLKKAKAVLSGADYSLLQTKERHGFLRRSR